MWWLRIIKGVKRAFSPSMKKEAWLRLKPWSKDQGEGENWVGPNSIFWNSPSGVPVSLLRLRIFRATQLPDKQVLYFFIFSRFRMGFLSAHAPAASVAGDAAQAGVNRAALWTTLGYGNSLFAPWREPPTLKITERCPPTEHCPKKTSPPQKKGARTNERLNVPVIERSPPFWVKNALCTVLVKILHIAWHGNWDSASLDMDTPFIWNLRLLVTLGFCLFPPSVDWEPDTVACPEDNNRNPSLCAGTPNA